MKLALVGLLLLPTQLLSAGLERYPALVRADSSPARGGSIRVTYLGVNGYQLEAGDRGLLIDPYFTRAGFLHVALGRPLKPDAARIASGLEHVRRPVDAILVTHGHFDHLLDASVIMKETGARLVAGPTAVRLAQAAGAPPDRYYPVGPSSRLRLGPWSIRVLPAAHDRLFGRVPYTRALRSNAAPEKPDDWVLGEPLAFLIEANGRRVYIESGGDPESLPQLGQTRVDLAIIGVALPDSRRRYAAAVRKLGPRFVLPSHQDNFFAPAARGFSFAPMTNFPSVRRIHAEEKLPAELILLDYFRPWTIP